MELSCVKNMYADLQAKFDRGLWKVFEDASQIVTDRAVLYDYQRPVWERVHFPGGFLQEIGKKVARLKQETAQEGFMPEMWPACREELLDIINYAAFMVSYGNMLEEDCTTGSDAIDLLLKEVEAMRVEDPPIQEQFGFPGLDAAVNIGHIDADTNVPMGPLPEAPSEPEPEPKKVRRILPRLRRS